MQRFTGNVDQFSDIRSSRYSSLQFSDENTRIFLAGRYDILNDGEGGMKGLCRIRGIVLAVSKFPAAAVALRDFVGSLGGLIALLRMTSWVDRARGPGCRH